MFQLLIILVPVIYLLLVMTCLKLLPYRNPFQLGECSYDLGSAFTNLCAATVLHLIAAGVLVGSFSVTGKELRSWLMVSLVFYGLGQLGLLSATSQLLRSGAPIGDSASASRLGCLCGLCGLLLLIPGGLVAAFWWLIGNLKFGGI